MGNETTDRLVEIKAAWQEVPSIRVYRESYVLKQMDAYLELVRKLVGLKEFVLLKDLVCDVKEEFPAVGILREEAVQALLAAEAYEEARDITRLTFNEIAQYLSILIAVAGATQGAQDIELVRNAIREHIKLGPALVVWLIRAWSTIGDDKDLKDAREVADFLPPIEKAQAYLAIGLRTERACDFLTSIQAALAITDRDEKIEVLKTIARIICLTLGIDYVKWVMTIATSSEDQPSVPC